MKLFLPLLSLLLPFTTMSATPLTFDAALARAAQHPRLVAQQTVGRAAAALTEQAGQRPVPVLGVSLENFAGTGASRGFNGFETTVELSQTIERGDKRTHRTALAVRAEAIAAAEFAVLQRDARARTAAAYIAALTTQARLELAATPLALARATLAAVEDRVQAGESSPAESARARTVLALTQAEFARAEAAFTSALAALAVTWGGEPTTVTSLMGELTVPDALPAVEELLARLPDHPQLALQHAVVSGRRASLRLEQSHNTQDITVAGGLRFLREGSDAALVAGISVPLPTRNRNQGGIRAARENLTGAEQILPAVEQELRAAFTAAWQELIAAHAAVIALCRDALPAATEAHAIVRQAYEEGQLPLLDVLDAQRALADLQREILHEQSAFATALVRLEALTDPTFSLTSSLLSSP